MGNGAKESQRKPRMSRAAGLSLARSWQSSGLSRAEFCRRERLETHVLRYWVRQLGRKAKGGRAERSDAGLPGGHGFVVVSTPSEDRALDASSRQGPPASSAEPGAKAVVVVVPLQQGSTALARTLRAVLEEASP